MGGSNQNTEDQIWLDEVDCDENATMITQCHHWQWGDHNCQVTENLVIKCGNRKALKGVCFQGNCIDWL